MKVNGYEVLDGLWYTKEHEWLKIEDGLCRMGVTDYAQKSLQDIVYVELPEIGKTVSQMEPIGTIESVKAVSDVYSPVSGEVVERNERLSDAPELVNKDPYGEGWMLVIKPSSLEDDIKRLLDAKAYAQLILEVIAKK